MRITCIIGSMNCGGAERVMTTICNHWSSKGREITLLTFDDGSIAPFYDLNTAINHISLNINSQSKTILKAVSNTVNRLQVIRTEILRTQPDVVISFQPQENVLSIVSSLGLDIPVIVSEHHYPAYVSISRPWKLLRSCFYPYATCITLLTQSAINCFPQNIQARSRVLPNPIYVDPTNTGDTSIELKRPSLIAMGRLVSQKGFDLLLQAFSKISKSYPSWHLTILGEGPLRQDLESLKDKLGLSEQVSLIGRVANPHDYLRAADLYVMSSRHEGFPMALCEAMACGLPVISMDCQSGPAEIIRPMIDGILVPNNDVPALAQAMESLMSQDNVRHDMAKHAPEVLDRFGIESVMRKWDDMFRDVLMCKYGEILIVDKILAS